MAQQQQNRNQQTGRNAPPGRDDPRPPRGTSVAASLDYPPVAEEYGIEKPLWLSLRNMFPAANENSIVMVNEYCKVRHLDPLKRPVHIVPMWNSSLNAMVDQIYPGIQEMRTTASRTREYAGQDPAVLGPMIQVPITNNATAPPNVNTIEVPQSVTVTVYRLVQGKRYAFTNTEYYLEAVARDRSGLINDMWRKRPIGQLSKCAEAGALRKAFPEELGGEYAAEEMMGREEMIPVDAVIEGSQPAQLTHGASGIPGPEADEEQPAGNGAQAADADDATDTGFDPDSDGTQMIPREVVEAARAEATKPAEEKPKPEPRQRAAKPKPEPASTQPDTAAADAAALERMDQRNAQAQQPAQGAGDGETTAFKNNLQAGAAGVIRARLESANVTEAQLLNKLGADLDNTNINTALGLLKVWQ